MKIVHHSNILGMGGTEKTMQYFLEYLKFVGHDCYCMAWETFPYKFKGSLIHFRKSAIENIIGKDKLIFYKTEEDFFNILDGIKPDIFHVHRSGNPNEFPVVPRLKKYVKKCVETNIFGGVDDSNIIDLSLYVNDHLMDRAVRLRRKKAVLYNPVKLPAHSNNLREKLNIDESTFVMGRIGRPDRRTFDPIALKALRLVENKFPIIYLYQSPCELALEEAKILNLSKVKFLTEPIISDEEISSFYNTLDVLAHCRFDGETFGMNISEAMIHKVPVISHMSSQENGHIKFVKTCGFVTRKDDFIRYANYIKYLSRHEKDAKSLGEKGFRFAEENFLLDKIGRKLEDFYIKLLSEK